MFIAQTKLVRETVSSNMSFSKCSFLWTFQHCGLYYYFHRYTVCKMKYWLLLCLLCCFVEVFFFSGGLLKVLSWVNSFNTRLSYCFSIKHIKELIGGDILKTSLQEWLKLHKKDGEKRFWIDYWEWKLQKPEWTYIKNLRKIHESTTWFESKNKA